jgi:dihydroorotase-like cyclic amidohydrolase
MITLPGLIDPHVHLRDPGQTQKEDFLTGTSAALAGGFTTVIDMPNNTIAITTKKLLEEKMSFAREKIVADIGFFFGSLGQNLNEFEKVKDLVLGLKLYLNITTGGYIIDEKTMKKIYGKWHEVTHGAKPILLHAEEDIIDSVAKIIKDSRQPTHIVHVSSEEELTEILKLKDKGLPITTGVTPHHLFLTQDDEQRLGPFGLMKPPLKTKTDQDFLWKHINDIDVIESDHAPHTPHEKQSVKPPFGVPGLETTVPLLLTAMHEGKITKEDIIDKCYTKPKEIFNLPEQADTYIEVDEKEEWIIQNDTLQTRCKWSPFDGWKVTGKVKKVVIRGTNVFEDGRILVDSGFGEII